MEEQRDKLPAQDAASEDPAPAAIPEEAEIIEIVDDDASQAMETAEPPMSFPSAAPVDRLEPDFPQEALSQIRTLRAQLDRKDKQIEQVMEAYRSTKSESERLRERISKTEKRRFEQSKGDFIARFVEVLDNLDRAIDSIEQSFDADSVLQGIMLVRSRLVQLLKTEGLEKIFVRGQPFDPMHSEAAEMEVVPDETQDGVVVKELQPGYMLKGSLLRAARVVVGQFGAEDEPTDPAPQVLDTNPDQEQPSTEASGQEPPLLTVEDLDPDDDWEANESGHELQFSDDGFDFSKD